MKFVLIAFTLLTSFVSFSQKVYSINTPVGFVLKAKTINDTEMSFDEKKSPTLSKTITHFRLICTKVNENDIDFSMILDSISLTVTDKGKKKYANSTIPSTFKDDEKLSGVFEVIGKELPVKVAKNGKLIKGDSTPQMAEYCFLQFGEQVIGVGQEWQTSQDLDSYGMKSTINTKNKLESIENGMLKIWSSSQNDLLGPEPVSAYMYADENFGILKSYECSVTTKLFGTMIMKINYSASW